MKVFWIGLSFLALFTALMGMYVWGIEVGRAVGCVS